MTAYPRSGSGSGVPAGGTTNQVLKKNSNTDGDASWGTPVTTIAGATDASIGSIVNNDLLTYRASDGKIIPVGRSTVAPSWYGLTFLGRIYGQATDRGGQTNNQDSNATNTDTNSRTRWVLRRAVPNLALSFANWREYSQSTELANSITVSAGIEMPGGGIVPIYFNGSRTVVIQPGGAVVSDPIGAPMPSGQAIFVRSRVTVSAGQVYPRHLVTDNTLGEGSEEGVGTTTDKTITGTVAASYGYAYGPLAILGLASPGSRGLVGGVGDSIMNGATDSPGLGQGVSTADWGYARRACVAAGNPFFNAGVGGDKFQFWADTTNYSSRTYHLRRQLVASSAHIICQLGINDVTGGRTLAQIQADALAVWKTWSDAGIRVHQATLTPHTTSTDAWATLGNQTVIAGETVRTNFNDWLRGGAPIVGGVAVAVGTGGAILTGQAGHYLYDYYETADTVESARNSGKWVVGSTGDGLHPNGTGFTAMALAVPAGSLA